MMVANPARSSALLGECESEVHDEADNTEDERRRERHLDRKDRLIGEGTDRANDNG